MIGVVVATHGNLAQELIRTAEAVVGKLAQVSPISVVASAPDMRHEIEEAIRGVDQGDGVVLLTDLLGGQINYDYNFFLARRDRVVAFASGGAGLVNISTFGFVTNTDLVGDKVEITYNVGGGTRFFGGRRAGFRTDVHRTHFSDNGVDINFWELTAGMSIVLGGTY